MMKKFFLILFLIFGLVQSVNAEQLPIKFTPAQTISTHNDEIQIGDWIRFKIINDVYVNNKLYISKGTPLIGIVDYVHENGNCMDNAEIIITKFITRDTNNTKITIYSTLKLNRKDYIAKTLTEKCIKYIGVIFRGSEIKIDPGAIIYNIFITR